MSPPLVRGLLTARPALQQLRTPAPRLCGPLRAAKKIVRTRTSLMSGLAEDAGPAEGALRAAEAVTDTVVQYLVIRRDLRDSMGWPLARAPRRPTPQTPQHRALRC